MASQLLKEIAQRFESLEKIKWEGLTVEEVGTKPVTGGGEPVLYSSCTVMGRGLHFHSIPMGVF